MINRNKNVLKDIPNFWEKVQIFDGSDIPKSDPEALWEDILERDWNPFKK